jgi:Fimbrial assembly protein (PilN)
MPQKLMDHGRAILGTLLQPRSAQEKKRRVVVLARNGERSWRALDGEVGGDRIRISGTHVLDEGQRLPDCPDATLVSNSRKSVCRLLSLAEAPNDQVQRMVSLRLETELPYAVTDSTWVCERQANGSPTSADVLVIATATSEIVAAEDELRKRGIRCTGVEFNGAALAELAAAHGSSECPVAVADLGRRDVTLVVAQGGTLRYVRHIQEDLPGDLDAEARAHWLTRVGNELDQSVCDYVLRGTGGPPERMLIVGEGASCEGVAESLGNRLGISVEPAQCPDLFDTTGLTVEDGELLRRFPACAGALLALHRRARGGRAVAPALRQPGRAFAGLNVRDKRTLLIAFNAVLLVCLVAACFVVRATQLAAAGHVVERSRAGLRQMERTQAEVDTLQQESRRQRSTLDVLLALAEVLPKEIKVEKLTVDSKGKITVRGKTKSVKTVSEEVLSAMSASSVFTKPVFLGASSTGDDEFEFSITCQLQAGAKRGRP